MLLLFLPSLNNVFYLNQYLYLNHLSVYSNFIKSSYLSGRARLVEQIHHLVLVDFTFSLIVKNSKNSPDVVLAHRQLRTHELVLHFFQQRQDPFPEEFVRDFLESKVFKDGDEI